MMLYVLLIFQPVTGILQSMWRGKPFALLLGEFPVLVAKDKPLMHLWHDVHETGAQLFIALIALHAMAGLFHGLIRRDGALRAMLPFAGKGRA